MIFRKLKLKDAFIIEPEQIEDSRGGFARTFCKKDFKAHGLNPNILQCNHSYNRLKGTLRGMHYQSHPKQEAKLVRCIRGAVHDVIIDIRPDSETYLEHIVVKLTEETRLMLYIPCGFAHGFQTLCDNTELLYQMSEFYSPEHSMGIRWDDPAINIKWPLAKYVISEKDMSYPLIERIT